MKKSEDKLSWVVKQYEEYKKDTEIQIWDLEDELFAWKEEYKKLKKENIKLNEKIRFLEECLDRKEKVNKSLREENSKLKDELQEWLNAVWNK